MKTIPAAMRLPTTPAIVGGARSELSASCSGQRATLLKARCPLRQQRDERIGSAAERHLGGRKTREARVQIGQRRELRDAEGGQALPGLSVVGFDLDGGATAIER